MKKKLLVVAFAGLAMLATACGGGNDQGGGGKPSGGDGAKVTDVSAEISVWAAAEEKPVVEHLVEEYNKKQTDAKAKFNVTVTAISESDAGSTVAKNPAADDAPALFLGADDQMEGLIGMDALVEITGEYKTKVAAEMDAVAVSSASKGEALYGYPISADNGYFLWYNKKELSSEDVKSFEKILEVAKNKKKKFLMDVTGGWYAPSFLMSPDACGQNSLSYGKDEEGKISYTVNWDNDTGVKVSEYIAELLTPAFEDGYFINGGNEQIIAGMGDGSMIAAVSGTWLEADLLKGATKEDIAAVKLPSYKIDNKDYQMGSFMGAKVYMINKAKPTAQKVAANALAQLLTNKESQLYRFSQRKTLPCNLEAQKDKAYLDNISIGGAALVEQNKFASVQSKSAEGRYWDVGAAIGKAYTDGDLGTAKSWAEFLKNQCDSLRLKS